MAPRQINPKKLKDGQWEIYFYTNGKGSKRIRRKFPLRKDADAWIKTYLNEKGQETAPLSVETQDPESFIFKTEYEYWINGNKNHFSLSYLTRVEGIRKRLIEFFKDKPIYRYTITDFINLQNHLVGLGLAKQSVNRNTEVLKAVINYSVRAGRLRMNPIAAGKKLPPIKTKETDYWSEEEVRSFLNFAKHRYEIVKPERRWIFTAYLLAINTGLRAGELWGLKVSDLRADRILITRQFLTAEREFATLKCKRTSQDQVKIVPLNSYVKTELDEHIKRNGLKTDDLLFMNTKGEGIYHDSFADMYHRDLERWGGKVIRFHDLRTTCITQLVSHGVDLRTVMEVAGHSDIKTTIGYAKMVGQNIDKLSQSFSLTPTTSGNT